MLVEFLDGGLVGGGEREETQGEVDHPCGLARAGRGGKRVAAGRWAWQAVDQRARRMQDDRGADSPRDSRRRGDRRCGFTSPPGAKSYASLMPPEALNAMNVEEQAARWRDIFRGRSKRRRQRGVFGVGRGRTAPRFWRLRPSAQSAPCGGGFSGRVFGALSIAAGAAARHWARADGRHGGAFDRQGFFQRLGLGVPRQSRRAPFYEALGGEKTGIDGEWTILGVTLPDMSYGWRDLSKLAAHQ